MVFELKQEFYSDIFLIQVHQRNFDNWRCSIMEDKYISTKLFINGSWVNSIKNETIDINNPATGDLIGTVSHAGIEDLDLALDSAQRGFLTWKKLSAFERSKIMRKAAEILKSRTKYIAELMTIESGKPIADAEIELGMGIDQIEWFAEEGRRAYGRIIPSRSKIVNQFVFKEPVGVVAAFTPVSYTHLRAHETR